MVWELHVWGPAFSLPSIDPQCLAAVAYCNQVLSPAQWVLKVGSDGRRSPTLELPALRDGHIWIGGFRSIVDYVRRCSDGKLFLDADLGVEDGADCVAFSSFLEARGRPLLDLSLYVSTRNYTTVTRAVYSSIQPFPLPYVTPSSIRSAAKSRTEHLGLSSLDIDSDTSHESREESVIPPSLRTARLTISSLLSQSPEAAAQIRLDALATLFFEPLQALKGEKRFFISSSPTSLDCLALGYLSLALLPDLPSPWLARCMRTKFPQFVSFVEDLQRTCFGGPVSLEDAYLVLPYIPNGDEGDGQRGRIQRARGNVLPWSPPDPAGISVLSSHLISGIANSTSLTNWLQPTRVKRRTAEQESKPITMLSTPGKALLATASTIILTLGILLSYSFHQGPSRRAKKISDEMIWPMKDGNQKDGSGQEKQEWGGAADDIQFDSAQDLLLGLGGLMDLNGLER